MAFFAGASSFLRAVLLAFFTFTVLMTFTAEEEPEGEAEYVGAAHGLPFTTTQMVREASAPLPRMRNLVELAAQNLKVALPFLPVVAE